jgi:tetratricopeptide (TPR) repeat protein
MFEKGNYEDALILLNEAYELINCRLIFKPNDWGIIVNRGDAYKYLGKLKESIADYNKAYEIE